jgi:tripartite-type tricarboxylate transporter receptor subunit TctC
MKNDLTIQESWFGMWAPVKIPSDVISILFSGISKALSSPSLAQSYESSGNIITPSQSPQAFISYMISENKKWTEIIKLTGITA